VAAAARSLAAAFAGGQDFALRPLKPVRDPFGALVAVDSAIRDSSGVEMSAAEGAWTAAAWSADAGAPSTPLSIGMSAWDGPEQWSLVLATPGGAWSIARSGDRVMARRDGLAPREALLESPPAGRPGLEQATAAYRSAAARFPAFRDLRGYRARASLGIGGLVLLQFAALWAAARLGLGRRWPLALVTVGWAAVGGWLYYVYLV
jgi:hypothetical protein